MALRRRFLVLLDKFKYVSEILLYFRSEMLRKYTSR